MADQDAVREAQVLRRPVTSCGIFMEGGRNGSYRECCLSQASVASTTSRQPLSIGPVVLATGDQQQRSPGRIHGVGLSFASNV
jgi:hypothetical protein